MITKTENNRAWYLVIPVIILMAFNAFIPLMTVVNYSFQETFGDNVFFWEWINIKIFQSTSKNFR